MADTEPQATVYEAPPDIPSEPVEEITAETLDEVVEQAVERAAAEAVQEAVKEAVEEAIEEPVEKAIEEIVDSRSEDVITQVVDEATHEDIADEPVKPQELLAIEPVDVVDSASVASDDTTVHRSLEKIPEQSEPTESTEHESIIFERQPIPIERQPTIIVTRDTIEGPIEVRHVTDEPVATASSSSSSTNVVPAQDAQSTTTTEPMIKKTVTFVDQRKPRLILDRGRNKLLRQPIVKALLGRHVDAGVGPEIRRLLDQAAGKTLVDPVTAAAAAAVAT